MIPTLKAEFRKLLTVRSTYFIVGIALLLVVFFAGFVGGMRTEAPSLLQPTLLATRSSTSIIFVGLVLAFAGMLLAGHEYRYSTIMYTLTMSNRRYKVLLAKVIVVTVFALATSLLVTFFAPLCAIVGIHLAGKHLVPQTFDAWSLIWRCLFCGWGYAMYAFIVLVALRNQVGAIVTFLLVPLIGENILSALLHSNSKYLPFNAVQSVADPVGLGNHTTSGHAAVTVLAYAAVGLLVGAILFIRRDTN